MTKTMWTFAPAGVLGQGIADARPYAGVVVCPTAEPVRGTGLPAVGRAADACTPGDVARLRSVSARTYEPVAQKFIDQQSTQHDGTTLGIHSSGRPQS